MRKYLIRYLVFWLPAYLTAVFFNNTSMVSQVFQWFFTFFMIFGWVANTAMAAYHYPRATAAALLTYSGFHILLISFMFFADSRTGMYTVMRAVGGFFCFKPIDILLQALRPITTIPLPWEYILLGVICLLCLVGFLLGVVQRWVNPDPYSPRFRRSW